METREILRLPDGSLAIVTCTQDRVTFTAYAVKLAQNNKNEELVPMLALGPKPQTNGTLQPGFSHPVFLEVNGNTPSILLSSRPMIEPVLDENNTGIDAIRATFGHPQGGAKIFIAGADKYIGVDDGQGGLYFVNIGRWQLSREQPRVMTAICSRWIIWFKDGDQDDNRTVVARFG